MTDTVRVERAVVLAAPSDEVWRALTEEALLEEWLASEVELDLEEGGEVVVRFEDGEERYGHVEAVDEGHRLALRWRREAQPETLVEFSLEEVPEGCRLVVVESGPPLATPVPDGGEWGPRLQAFPVALALAPAAR